MQGSLGQPSLDNICISKELHALPKRREGERALRLRTMLDANRDSFPATRTYRTKYIGRFRCVATKLESPHRHAGLSAVSTHALLLRLFLDLFLLSFFHSRIILRAHLRSSGVESAAHTKGNRLSICYFFKIVVGLLFFVIAVDALAFRLLCIAQRLPPSAQPWRCSKQTGVP